MALDSGRDDGKRMTAREVVDNSRRDALQLSRGRCGGLGRLDDILRWGTKTVEDGVYLESFKHEISRLTRDVANETAMKPQAW